MSEVFSCPFPLDACLHTPALPVVPAHVAYLGRIDYAQAHALQLRLIDDIAADRRPDTLLFCEHPAVVTVGRRQQALRNILSSRFPVVEVERGGDVTYHGPGQLVGYPLLKLRPLSPLAVPDPALPKPPAERDLHRYLRALEGALIDLLVSWGIPAARCAGATGVWTSPIAGAPTQQKLASMGIAVRRWVTFHGFALNVTTDLSHFAAINPCGFAADVMTSMAAQCTPQEALALDLPSLLGPLTQHLGQRLRRSFSPIDPQVLFAPS